MSAHGSGSPAQATSSTELLPPKPSGVLRGLLGLAIQRAPSMTNLYSWWPSGSARVLTKRAPSRVMGQAPAASVAGQPFNEPAITHRLRRGARRRRVLEAVAATVPQERAHAGHVLAAREQAEGRGGRLLGSHTAGGGRCSEPRRSRHLLGARALAVARAGRRHARVDDGHQRGAAAGPLIERGVGRATLGAIAVAARAEPGVERASLEVLGTGVGARPHAPVQRGGLAGVHARRGRRAPVDVSRRQLTLAARRPGDHEGQECGCGPTGA